MHQAFRSLVIFLLSLGWFALILPWSGFVDPDAFYHAKISALMWSQGPLQTFPWLDLTTFGQHFADLHFLFHLFVSPFTSVFGMFDGLRIASLVLAASCVTILYFCLCWLSVKRAEWWAVLLVLAQPFVFRLLLNKATPLALLWYIFGLTATWKRRPWLVGLATLGFSLSHGGVIYLVGSVVLVACGEALFDRLVEDRSWCQVLRGVCWREIGASVLGWAIGLILHPNFPQNILLTWTQVVTIGLGTPFQHVVLGNEWRPANLAQLMSTGALPGIVLIICIVGLCLAPQKPVDRVLARRICSSGIIVAVLCALTIKSRRNVEYLIPMSVMWSAFMWSSIDESRLRIQFRQALVKLGPRVASCVPLVLFGLLLTLGVQAGFRAWRSFHPPKYPDEMYTQTMQAISNQAQPGDRVFHSSWDEFPMLFAFDDRLRYVSGLDPTFLYVASSTLSDAVRDVTWDVTSSTAQEAWKVIHDQLNSRFVFISKKHHSKLLGLIEEDKRYTKLAEDAESAAFKIQNF